MVSTFVFFLLPLIFLSFLDVYKDRGKTYGWLYFLSCAYILSFSSGIVERSGDYINYRDSFENVNSWQEYIAGSTIKGYAFEPGFFTLYFLIKNFPTTDGNMAVVIVTLLSGGGLLYFIRKYSRCFFIALVVYIAHFYWWLGIVLLRQMCAMVILFPVIRLLQEEKWRKSIMLIALASLFHASALIFYVFLVIKKLKLFRNERKVIFLLVFSFLVGYLDLFTIGISLIAGYVPRGMVLMNYLMEGSERLMNILAYVEMLLVLFVALKYRLKLLQVNKYTDIAIEFLIFSLFIGGLFYHYEIGSRFVMYFNFYSYLILLPNFISLFRQNLLNKGLYVLGLECYLLIFLIRFVYITV